MKKKTIQNSLTAKCSPARMGKITTKDFRKERALVSIDYGDRPPGLESNLSMTLDKSFKLSVPKSPHRKM